MDSRRLRRVVLPVALATCLVACELAVRLDRSVAAPEEDGGCAICGRVESEDGGVVDSSSDADRGEGDSDGSPPLDGWIPEAGETDGR